MGTVIATQMVPQGLLVPRSALGEWLERGVDVVKEKERIVIRPRPACWMSVKKRSEFSKRPAYCCPLSRCLLLTFPFLLRSGRN